MIRQGNSQQFFIPRRPFYICWCPYSRSKKGLFTDTLCENIVNDSWTEAALYTKTHLNISQKNPENIDLFTSTSTSNPKLFSCYSFIEMTKLASLFAPFLDWFVAIIFQFCTLWFWGHCKGMNIEITLKNLVQRSFFF